MAKINIVVSTVHLTSGDYGKCHDFWSCQGLYATRRKRSCYAGAEII
jgi:hypothetical protein